MRHLDDERHFQYFRMSASKFDNLLHRIAPLITHDRRHCSPVDASQRLAVTLRYLATGISQQALAASDKLGRMTVCNIVQEVCEAIWTALESEFVAFPSEAQWKTIAEDFWRLWDFPFCLGAIDGKHVRIRVHSGSDYFNYKGYCSIILMAACDARYRFTYVDVGAFGRESDGGVFSRSAFGSQLINGELPLPAPAVLPGSQTMSPYVFLGDEAFPLRMNLMRPYPGSNLSMDKKIYNYRQARARRVVENGFGIMASCFRIFSRPIDCSPKKVVVIIKACVALHNFLCQTESTRYIPSGLVDTVTSSGELQQGEWRQVVEGDTNLLSHGRLTMERATRLAVLVREQFKDYFLTESGMLPYQERIVQRGTLQSLSE
ncbi:hypothetical protein SKAU_G00155410 [Synaphobranchus kaupii]|uniref:DDE Tnp4 domain-containing protein n=1 Tax=Synaphobranchus kaupii TaxID=118154 RepID=A0A9Q1FHK8_SYNKA|nr:hypothetical protein SKAU_G00155410 [Synaphobranchus kaupii]